MTIHKEGYKTIALSGFIYVLLNLLNFTFLSYKFPVIAWIIFIATTAVFVFLISFFRLPKRSLTVEENSIVSPCDGKVVVIEETTDPEYFKDRRLQISIFMSPANVHVNRNPVSGEVLYSQHHKGKFLVAWDPKSSTDNERHSVVIRNSSGEILVKQIAGALAKRIVNYLKVGQKVTQSEEMGFIKFGSRVDLLLPPGTQVTCKLGENVKGGITILAKI
ncbi:MAG TPA: phosphatidylserine decarboxylase family protein [Chitinophagaceae bacterium]|nr:phosphatidylserine decarboxylase family protein [Chitinophagaceae bacterium]